MCWKGHGDERGTYQHTYSTREKSPPRYSYGWSSSSSSGSNSSYSSGYTRAEAYVTKQEQAQREKEKRETQEIIRKQRLRQQEEEQRKIQEEAELTELAERFYRYFTAYQQGKFLSLLIDGGINNKDVRYTIEEKLLTKLQKSYPEEFSQDPEKIKQSFKLISDIIFWYFSLLNSPDSAKKLVLGADTHPQVIDYINHFLNLTQCNNPRNLKTLTITDGGEITADQLAGLMRHIEYIWIHCTRLSDDLINKISAAKQKVGVDCCLRQFVLRSGIQASTTQVKKLLHLLDPVGVHVHRLSSDKGCSWEQVLASTQAPNSSFSFSGSNSVTSEDINEILSFSQVSKNSLCFPQGGFSPELSISSPEKITELSIAGQKFYTSIGDGKFEKLLTNFSRLERLNFNNIGFHTPEAKTAFLTAVAKKTALTDFILNSCQLKDNDLEKFIIPYLRANKDLTNLSLRDNEFTPVGITRLAEYIRDSNLNILSVDVFPRSFKGSLLEKVLERNRNKKLFEAETEAVRGLLNKHQNFDGIFEVKALQAATSELSSAHAKCAKLIANDYPSPNGASDLVRQVLAKKKELFLAWLNAIVVQPDVRGKLLCHTQAVEVLRSLDWDAANVSELYSVYENNYLPQVATLTESGEVIPDLGKLFDLIKSILIKHDAKQTDRKTQLFFLWLDIVDRQADPRTKLLCCSKALEYLNQLDLPIDKLAGLYSTYEARCLPAITSVVTSGGPVPEVEKLFRGITGFLTKKRADGIIGKAAHFIAMSQVCVSDDILHTLCNAVKVCQCEDVMKDLVKIYIYRLRPTHQQFNQVFTRLPIKDESYNDLYTQLAYSLHTTGSNATDVFENCRAAVSLAGFGGLNKRCLFDSYVAYAVALKKVLDSQNVDKQFLDLKIWQNLYDFLLKPPVAHNRDSIVDTCRALLKLCQAYLEKGLRPDSEFEAKFINFLRYCTAILPLESRNNETCLVKIYKTNIVNIMGADLGEAEIYLKNNLENSPRLADVLSQLNTYFNKRGTLSVYFARMKEDSVASRLAVLQTELQSLVPLFKVESLAPTAQLNLAGSSVPAAASPPPSYADPVPAAVARVSTAATTQVLSHSGRDSSESSLAPPTYVEGPSSVIDDDDKSVSVPAAKASHKAPAAAAVAKSMSPILKKKAPAQQWPTVPHGEVDVPAVPVAVLVPVHQKPVPEKKAVAEAKP